MDAEDARPPGGAGLPSSGYIKAVSDQIGKVQRELHRDWLFIRFLAVVILGLGIWIVVDQFAISAQQATLNSKTTDIARLERQAAASNARDARNAHNLCVKLNQSRAVIVGVWGQVQFRPGVDPAAQLAKIKAAEPLGKCPGSAAAGR